MATSRYRRAWKLRVLMNNFFFCSTIRWCRGSGCRGSETDGGTQVVRATTTNRRRDVRPSGEEGLRRRETARPATFGWLPYSVYIRYIRGSTIVLSLAQAHLIFTAESFRIFLTINESSQLFFFLYSLDYDFTISQLRFFFFFR